MTQDDFFVHYTNIEVVRTRSYTSILIPPNKHAKIPKETGLSGLIKNGRQFPHNCEGQAERSVDGALFYFFHRESLAVVMRKENCINK